MYGEATVDVLLSFLNAPGFHAAKPSIRRVSFGGRSRIASAVRLNLDVNIDPDLRLQARAAMHRLGRRSLKSMLVLEATVVRDDDGCYMEIAPASGDPDVPPDAVVYELRIPDWHPVGRLSRLAFSEQEKREYFDGAGLWAQHFDEDDRGGVTPNRDAQEQMVVDVLEEYTKLLRAANNP